MRDIWLQGIKMTNVERQVLQVIINHGPIVAKRIKGKITDYELSKDDTTNRAIRKIINDLTIQGWPIAADHRGFYLAYQRKDKRRYRRRLRSFIKGIEERIQEFDAAWRMFKSDENYYMHIVDSSRRQKRRKIKRRKS